MEPATRDAAEESLRKLWSEGRWEAATEALLRTFGKEVYQFLAALHAGRSADADDAFGFFAEGVWRGMSRFEGSCTFRTWAYAIARRCSLRARRDARRRGARNVALPSGSEVSMLAEKIRTETASWLASRPRSRIAELRARLPEADQTLLMLRIDRKLQWVELARVLGEGDDDAPALDDASLKKEAARLRKRFQLLKDRLREQAQREGLVPRSEVDP